MTIAWTVSVLIHILFAVLMSGRPMGYGTMRQPPVSPPIVVNLQPESPDVRRLVDVLTSTDEPVSKTDLIAETASKAADKAISEGDNPGPRLDKIDEIDTLATPPTPPDQAPEPIPQPAPQKPKADPAKNVVGTPPKAPSNSTVTLPSDTSETSTPEPVPEPFRVAKAPPAHEDELPKGESKGRLHNEVKREGFTNFEAMKDDIAPYLKTIRKEVEKRWVEALVTRYSGTQPTQAVIDCEIAPDGRLVSAQIVEPIKDPLYASLCKQALEKSGPFGPFPFKVPDMYRNKNLEIRWTFSFL